MIKPLPNRIIVKLVGRYDALENKLNLTLVDQKKHFDGVRWGKVVAVGSRIFSIQVGDMVYFSGSAGESFGITEDGASDGTDYRRLSLYDVMAVEDKAMVEVA